MTIETETPQYAIMRYGYANAPKMIELMFSKNFDTLLAMPHEITTAPTQLGFGSEGVSMMKPLDSILTKNTATEFHNGMATMSFKGTYNEESPVIICFHIK